MSVLIKDNSARYYEMKNKINFEFVTQIHIRTYHSKRYLKYIDNDIFLLVILLQYNMLEIELYCQKMIFKIYAYLYFL